MDTPYRFRPNQPVSWFSSTLHRSNQHCLYCGALVGVGSSVRSDREHLVARHFVPKGSLDATAFNFIFRACMTCNRLKGDAERHVSSVSLFNSPGRAENSEVDAIAAHKATSDFHPAKPGIRVADSSISRTYDSRFGSARLSFGMVGPPQIDAIRACTLACNQIQALFSLVTTRNPRVSDDTILLRANYWHYLGIYSWRDWGNVQLTELSRRICAWPVVLRITTAKGYFRAILRATEKTPDEWFWGLEWNRSIRMVGSIYRDDSKPAVFDDLPMFDWRQIAPNARMREEVPQPEDQDLLFGE
jgi:hypothetical protein